MSFLSHGDSQIGLIFPALLWCLRSKFNFDIYFNRYVSALQEVISVIVIKIFS